LYKAVQALIAYRVVRPGYGWLLDHGLGDIYQLLFDTTERDARDGLRQAAHELGLGTHAMTGTWRLLGRVLAHTGKSLREVAGPRPGADRQAGTRARIFDPLHPALRPAGAHHRRAAALPVTGGPKRQRGVFSRRKLALGDCYRPYGTDCPHEHACVRRPMLRMDVEQLPRLVQIEVDTYRLLDEAKRKGWEGETAGLETTLVHIKDKKAQVERLHGVDSSLLSASALSLSQSAGRGRASGTRRRAAAGRG
jgi:hypothetical protein